MSDDRPTAGDPAAADGRDGADGRTFDPERTVGGDADLLAEVRSAVEAARRGLAAPPGAADATAPTAPTELADDDTPPTAPTNRAATRATSDDHADPAPAPGAHDPTLLMPATLPPPAFNGTALTPPPGPTDPTRVMPLAPPIATAAAGEPTVALPATAGGTPPTEVMPAQPGPAAPQRWVPPARLKPAATPAPAAFLEDPAPKRTRVWWIVGAAALVVAAGVGIVVATSGDSTPSDDSTPLSGTVPVTTAAASTSVVPTSVRPTTTAAATTAATTTAAPTTTAVSPTEAPTTAPPPTEAPTTLPPDTVAPAETVPAAPGG